MKSVSWVSWFQGFLFPKTRGLAPTHTQTHTHTHTHTVTHTCTPAHTHTHIYGVGPQCLLTSEPAKEIVEGDPAEHAYTKEHTTLSP